MKLLKKRSTAVIITAVIIVLMSVIGIVKAPVALPDVQTGQWVYDGANVLSAEHEQSLTWGNAALLADHGAVVAVATMPDLKGWDMLDFCFALAEKWGLSGSDFILVMDIGGDNYWLIQGADLVGRFTDEMAGQYARQFLENDFAAKQYGAGAVNLFNNLRFWYDGSAAVQVPVNPGMQDVIIDEPVSSGGGGMGATFLLIVLVIILLIVMDGVRYSNYRRRWYGVTPTVVYRPFIFGRPRRPAPPPPPGGPRPGGTTRPPTGGSFFGGTTTTRRPSSGGGRTSSSFGGGRTSAGGGRSSGFSGGRSSGSFGGGRSSSRSSGGFGGGRR